MNARELIQALGGPQAVTAETGLSKGRISQWQTSNHIPRPWVMFLRARFPRAVDWARLELAEREPPKVARKPGKPRATAHEAHSEAA
ncbi:hypothetical protein BKK79_35915 [Cupriavidus sp. USMAA2-4]|uniref:hypothetical protein n=1 Tax=Cupriavidus sp. USMAA2-4 TaxID=876364 RepID=UPI0008A6CA59|nr:hypothetical protein [Cupriavidus sp. USMAA2-4]AOY96882.1 hypothetical protein BKK79_35915 [Cupriavidus sp. USMAA2-4]